MDIVEQMRSFESDHEPDGWPAIQMKQVSALCDEVERSQRLLNGMASEVERLQSLLEQERQESLTASCRVAALQMELDSATSIIEAANAQEPDGFLSVVPLDGRHGHSTILARPLSPVLDGQRFYFRPIPVQQSQVATSDKVLFSGSHGHAGYVVEDQQSPAVSVPDYKEELFQLRQRAENWSSKLGLITDVIKVRKISLSEKEREFPHLLVQRLHTDSELLKQRSESPRITEHDAWKIAEKHYNYRRNKAANNIGSGFSDWFTDEGRDLINKLNEAKHD